MTLSPTDAMSLLFNKRDVELELDGGGILRMHLISLEGERATVTAPRLSVATGMTLTGRVVGPDARPWELHLHVDDASYHTQDLASGQNLIFAATGVTEGDLLQGVRFFGGGARTHSLIMGYQTKQVRFVDTVHMFDRSRPPAVRL